MSGEDVCASVFVFRLYTFYIILLITTPSVSRYKYRS